MEFARACEGWISCEGCRAYGATPFARNPTFTRSREFQATRCRGLDCPGSNTVREQSHKKRVRGEAPASSAKRKCLILFGGHGRNRTGVRGFAVRCVTTPPRGRSNSSDGWRRRGAPSSRFCTRQVRRTERSCITEPQEDATARSDRYCLSLNFLLLFPGSRVVARFVAYRIPSMSRSRAGPVLFSRKPRSGYPGKAAPTLRDFRDTDTVCHKSSHDRLVL